MKRKRQGASLIVVVIIIMFVSTVSAAIISMAAGNYKARVVESKRVENLYASDSGLDVVYTIIRKNFDAATKYGYYKVEELKKGTSTGPNNSKYQDIESDINYLNKIISDLKHENDNKDDKDKRKQSDIDKDIAKERALIEEDEGLLEILINEEFKRAFKNFIVRTADVKAEENVPEELLKDSIEGHAYVSSITASNLTNITNFEKTIEFGMENEIQPQLSVDNIDLKDASASSTKGIFIADGHSIDMPIAVCGSQYYDIAVTSDFYSEKDVNGVEYNSKSNKIPPNERKLQARYKVSVPNYEDIYSQKSTGDLHDYLALKDRALTIGGDMNIDNSDNLNVGGNIFVQGVDPTISKDGEPATVNLDNRTFEKYHGGIKISNSNQVKFSQNVITRNTFNVQDYVSAKIGGNLYGRNVYVGKLEAGDNGFAKESKLDVKNGQVILDNDLTLKAKEDSTINIKDFYGINDKNISYKDLEGNTINKEIGDKVKSSSSIIVNGNDSSTKINIIDYAYIMGTAHIDTKGDNEGYQTGESGAVKGNYIAYSVPLNEAEKFDYYEPLQLLNDSYVNDKAEHFADYWEGKSPNVGGIIWPHDISTGKLKEDNIFSIGAIVYQEGTQTPKVFIPKKSSQLLEEQGGEVWNKRADFANNVYDFGQAPTDVDAYNDYKYTRQTEFDSLMDLTKIPSTYNLTDQEGKGEYAIFNKDKGKEIVITKSDDDKDAINSDSDSNIIKIEVGKKDNDYKINATIATAGKVSIDSDINFNGSIIAEGDLNINGSNVKINYNSEVIERIQAQSDVTYETFKDVFGNNIVDTISDSDDGNNNTGDTQNSNNADSSYDLNNFLENKLWKIIK